MNRFILMASAASMAVVAPVGVAAARDPIEVTGSSTVFPYSQALADQFANKTGKPVPVVESVGTGGGFKAFCGGVEDNVDTIAVRGSGYSIGLD